jgi:lysophospholipase L1-like esterase
VLHIGDSFALAGFAKALKPKMKALGVRYEVRAETSSFTTTWAGKMELLVANTQPDLVIINLGANEVANVDPPAHAPAVRRIVAAIGGRPCVWVAAPSFRKDTGISDVIRQNSAPCRYYDSDKLVGKPIARQSDHIHPTDEGGAVWADAFWTWLQAERTAAPLAPGEKPSPWRLKPSLPEEHLPLAH